jgi:hypothetical protein
MSSKRFPPPLRLKLRKRNKKGHFIPMNSSCHGYTTADLQNAIQKKLDSPSITWDEVLSTLGPSGEQVKIPLRTLSQYQIFSEIWQISIYY